MADNNQEKDERTAVELFMEIPLLFRVLIGFALVIGALFIIFVIYDRFSGKTPEQRNDQNKKRKLNPGIKRFFILWLIINVVLTAVFAIQQVQGKDPSWFGVVTSWVFLLIFWLYARLNSTIPENKEKEIRESIEVAIALPETQAEMKRAKMLKDFLKPDLETGRQRRDLKYNPVY